MRGASNRALERVGHVPRGGQGGLAGRAAEEQGQLPGDLQQASVEEEALSATELKIEAWQARRIHSVRR